MSLVTALALGAFLPQAGACDCLAPGSGHEKTVNAPAACCCCEAPQETASCHGNAPAAVHSACCCSSASPPLFAMATATQVYDVAAKALPQDTAGKAVAQRRTVAPRVTTVLHSPPPHYLTERALLL